MELVEALSIEHGLTSIQKYEVILRHYTSIFGFKKENRVDKDERNKKHCEEENTFNFQVFYV